MLNQCKEVSALWEIVICSDNQTLHELQLVEFWTHSVKLRVSPDALLQMTVHCLMWMHADRIPLGEKLIIAARPLGQSENATLLQAERTPLGLSMTDHGCVRRTHGADNK